MIILTFCVFIALLTISVATVIRGGFARLNSNESVAAAIRRVDLPALANLLDEDEEDFLRRTLPGPSFKRVRRLRTRALLEYVSAIAYNAAVIMRWCEIARNSDEPIVAESARMIGRSAIEVRLRALQAICMLGASLIIPNIQAGNILPIQPYGRLKSILLASGAATGEAAQLAAQL